MNTRRGFIGGAVATLAGMVWPKKATADHATRCIWTDAYGRKYVPLHVHEQAMAALRKAPPDVMAEWFGGLIAAQARTIEACGGRFHIAWRRTHRPGLDANGMPVTETLCVTVSEYAK